MDEIFEMRDYLNEGGRMLYTGKNAGAQYTPSLGAQLYDPTAANGKCADSAAILPRCLPRGRLRRISRATFSSTGSAPTS